MKTGIVIVSGFLGAGKTTLIQKLIRDSFRGQRVALIENDFGEIGVDAALLGAGGLEVREINSGCICCTLTGDFVRALRELLERYRPEEVIIEPSGVGKLSDVIAACGDPRVQDLARLRDSITVVDVKRCQMYLENFGEFFEDQVEHADIIVLSRVEECPDRVSAAREMAEKLNDRAALVAWPMSAVTGDEILNARQKSSGAAIHVSHKGDGCCCHGAHEHPQREGCRHGDHAYGNSCVCPHEHDADEVFDTVTVHVKRALSEGELRTGMAQAEKCGTLLRAKGIVPGGKGYLNVQYLPENLQITDCAVPGETLCFIGQGLDRPRLAGLFTQ